MMQHSAVFLDRDGVLNEERGYITRPEELVLLPGAGQAVAQLNRSGYKVVVITNQSVVARGGCDECQLELVHDHMRRQLQQEGAKIDGLYYCPHHPDPGESGVSHFTRICECRKPSPGMLLRAAMEHGIDLVSSWMIGDSTSDIELARRVGVKSILVKTGYGGSDRRYAVQPDFSAADILSAVDLILNLSATR